MVFNDKAFSIVIVFLVWVYWTLIPFGDPCHRILRVKVVFFKRIWMGCGWIDGDMVR